MRFYYGSFIYDSNIILLKIEITQSLGYIGRAMELEPATLLTYHFSSESHLSLHIRQMGEMLVILKHPKHMFSVKVSRRHSYKSRSKSNLDK